MTGTPDSPVHPSHDAGQGPATHEAEPPRGTLFLTLVYLIVVIGLWTYMYLLMTERS